MGDNARTDWATRQASLGNSPRAVLMKGLPTAVNETIDRWHRSIIRLAFDGHRLPSPNSPALDFGCGYGRLVDVAGECGLAPIIGIDFTQQFCADFRRAHGEAVCGDLAHLPFREATFKGAYSVTALMYLPVEEARGAMRELDRCLLDGARVLILEPSREFNLLVRAALRRKKDDALAMPGLTVTEMTSGLAPGNWKIASAGGCTFLTLALPILIASVRFPWMYRKLSSLVLRLESRSNSRPFRTTRLAMYRWIVFEKHSVTNREVFHG